MYLAAAIDISCPGSSNYATGSGNCSCRHTAAHCTAAAHLSTTVSLLPLMAPVDVQTPQAPSTSGPALDPHGQPIQRPRCYKHSMKRKQHLQEEAEY
uniref:Uncharacterized protein n=1 Tax=Romanomermis culicivorax TaxID=13658 RepID=A0A915I3N7_ROMCU